MLLLSMLSSVAWPCAGLFHDTEQLAESDAQAVIFESVAEGTRASYSVDYEGDAESFGWLIPVFGEFVSIEERDPEVFQSLLSWTQPTVDYGISSSTGGGGGCSRANSKATPGGRFADTGYDGVNVVAEGFTGSYAYQVLDTSSSDAFLGWLDKNGWSTSGAEAAIEAYVKEGGVQFAAITLTEAGGDQLPPLALTYGGDQLRFPASMARNAMAEDIRTIVYVRSDATAAITGEWTATPIGTIEDSSGASPDAIYDRALEAIGGNQRGYGLVFSGMDSDGSWVTRFETLAAPSAHIADVFFEPGNSQDNHETIISVSEGRSEAWLLLPLALLGAGALRRRRTDRA
jgi:MYXO-CTERM domain-containing protein